MHTVTCTSGLQMSHRSKKWNKFDLWALLLAGLPWHESNKLENIHLIYCSNRASPLEMAQPLAEQLISLEIEGVEVFDSYLQ